MALFPLVHRLKTVMIPSKKKWAGVSSGFVLLCVVAAHAAPRDPSLINGELGFPPGDFVSYQFSDAPGPDGSPSITDQQEEAQFVVAKSSTDLWSVHERAGQFHLSSPITVAQTGLSVPQTLSSVEAGGAFGRRLENGHSFGVNVGVGSESDRLFNSIHETTLRASANYRLPTDPGRAWLFFLTYSNNRNFSNNIPLPGIAYSINAPHVKAILGFPFLSVLYTPTPQWEGRFSIFGPRHVTTEVGYKIVGPVQMYGRFEWGSEQWLQANREDNHERLFFDRKRWLAGIRSPISHGLLLDTSVGREFDRRFFENTSSSYRNVPTAALPDAWVIDARISLRFNTRKDDSDVISRRLGAS